MAALAALEQLEVVAAKVAAAVNDSERLALVINDGQVIGYGNVVKLLKGWTAEEVKLGKRAR